MIYVSFLTYVSLLSFTSELDLLRYDYKHAIMFVIMYNYSKIFMLQQICHVYDDVIEEVLCMLLISINNASLHYQVNCIAMNNDSTMNTCIMTCDEYIGCSL